MVYIKNSIVINISIEYSATYKKEKINISIENTCIKFFTSKSCTPKQKITAFKIKSLPSHRENKK